MSRKTAPTVKASTGKPQTDLHGNMEFEDVAVTRKRSSAFDAIFTSGEFLAGKSLKRPISQRNSIQVAAKKAGVKIATVRVDADTFRLARAAE